MADKRGSQRDSERDPAHWRSAIEAYRKEDDYQAWDELCEKIRDRYLYEGTATANHGPARYQMLWSNMEVLKPAIYAKPPVAVVKRRWNDGDKSLIPAAEMLERALNFQLSLNEWHDRLKQVRDDYLLYGRGVARIYYEARTGETKAADTEADSGGDTLEATSDTETEGDYAQDDEGIGFEHLKIRFVHRADFAHEPARAWDEVGWVAFRAFMSREELIERFGEEVGKAVPVSSAGALADSHHGMNGRSERGGMDKGAGVNQAIVWEIWDKGENCVYWIADGYDEFLDQSEPYLDVTGFFPCPKPCYGTLATDRLIPRPDYVFYKDQVEQIDKLTARISGLIDALKVVGFYDGGPDGVGAPQIERAMSPGVQNKLIAVPSWAAFKAGGGTAPVPVVWMPIEQVATVIKECVELREQMIQDVWQIMGISDIMRGEGQALETATAVQLKANFGSYRVRERQNELARFCGDLFRMGGEIVAKVFQPQLLMKMTGVQIPSQADLLQMHGQQMLEWRGAVQQAQGQFAQVQQQAAMQGQQPPPPPQAPPPPQMPQAVTIEDVMALYHDGVTRRFELMIEPDSTVGQDEQAERKDRTDYIAAVSQFVESWGPVVAAQPIMADLAGALLKFGSRAFRVGRELEDIIDDTAEKIAALAKAKMNAPPQADPKTQAAQVQLQAAQVKANAEMQSAQVKADAAQASAQSKAVQAGIDADQAHQDAAAAGFTRTARMQRALFDGGQ